MKKSRDRQAQREVHSAVADFNLIVRTIPPSTSSNLIDNSQTVENTLPPVAGYTLELESDSDSSSNLVLSESDELGNSEGESITDLSDSLRNWTISHNITAAASSDLLKLLHSHHCFKICPWIAGLSFKHLDRRHLLMYPRDSTVDFNGIHLCAK